MLHITMAKTTPSATRLAANAMLPVRASALSTGALAETEDCSAIMMINATATPTPPRSRRRIITMSNPGCSANVAAAST